MFASFKRIYKCQAVPVIRRPDNDNVDILVLKHKAVVDVELRPRYIKLCKVIGPPVEDIPVNITDSNNFNFGIFNK